MNKVKGRVFLYFLVVATSLVISMVIVMSKFSSGTGDVMNINIDKNSAVGSQKVVVNCPEPTDCTCHHFQINSDIDVPFKYSIVSLDSGDTLFVENIEHGLPKRFFREVYNSQKQTQNLKVELTLKRPSNFSQCIDFEFYPKEHCSF